MLVALLALDAAIKKSVRNFRCGLTKVRTVNTSSCSTIAASVLLQKDCLKRKVIFSPVETMDSGCNMQRPIATNTISIENALENGGSTENTNESNGAAIIAFQQGLKQCCQEISSSHVKVLTSPGNHDHGSSRVKLKNIVDYKWEIKNYPAHLIAVHLNERYVAYVINVNKVTRMEGMVRVVNTESALRALIKGMSGDVLDLQFAHIEKEHILACIDMNCLYVHQIDERDDTLLCNLIIKIESPLNNHTPKHDKISWCPFIDIPGEDDEDNQLIVWARGNIFQCFNINTIVAEHGIGKIIDNQIENGFIKHEDESIIITWVALSPDGSTLGVGNTDGIIRFYQVYLHDKDPRCLHEWKPHNGKPISSFFFLDNLTKTNTDIYWKFVITAACNNAEFKIWDCGTWNCLQTITMLSASDGGDKNLHFLAEIDRTSSYLVVSSLDTRACYVMQIINFSACSESIKDCASDNDEYSMALQKDTSVISNYSTTTIKSSNSIFPPNVYIKSVAEFPLNSGILSFSIIDAALRRYKCSNDDYLCEEMDDYDEETNSICCVVIRMYIVQSKSVQKCHILYQPMVQESADFKSTMSSSHSSDHISVRSKMLSPHNDCLSISFNQESDNGLLIANNDDNDEENENNINNDVVAELNVTNNTEKNPLELLLGIKAENNLLNGIQENLTTLSTGSTVMNVLVMNVPTTEETEKSPHAASAVNLSTTSFSQLNLMTPDAFTSPATSSTLKEQKTPENISTDVLNTILMLASVTGSSSKTDNLNMLNLSSKEIIENHELYHHHQQQQTPLTHDTENPKKFIAIDRNPGRNINDNLTSGGSSPSREVQEIMSLQDYKGSFSGDEQLLEEHSVKSLIKVEDTNTQTTTVGQESITKSNTKILWTEVSNTKHSTELLNAANIISQAVNASSMSSLNNGHLQQPNLSTNANANAPATRSNPELSEMNLKINELIDLVKMQSIQINTLQNGFNEMINANNLATINNNITELSYKLEIQLCKLMEQYLKRYETELKRRLAGLISEGDVKNQTLTETIVQVMNQCVLTQLGDVMNHEIQRQVAPMLSNKLDAFQHQIQVDVANKLSDYDEMLKENLADACKSKNILEAFGKSVLMGVQGSLQAAFIESMSSTLIPAYEKSSQNMFQQLHEAFSVGIKDFIDQYNNYLQQLQPMQGSTEDILNKFSGLNNNLESILAMHRATVQDFLMETRKDIKTLGHQLQGIIRSEVLYVRKSFESQAPVLRSQASTPAPIHGVKDTIKVLLMQGQINKAFHQALLANDLTLVEFTLKNADRYTIFTPTCCLEQKVLLSLIQQISADMNNHNEVKHSYLCESLLAMKHDDPIIIQHAPKVINELYRNCQLFLVSYPKSQQCSNVRILMKAVQNILDKFQYMSNC